MRDEIDQHDTDEAAAFGTWLIELTAAAMNCEPTIEAINATGKASQEFPFDQTVTFDELGILLGIDVQGNKATHRIKVDDLESFDNDEAECVLQGRLIDGWLEFLDFADKTYDPGPDRPPNCHHNGNCDC